MELQWTYSYAVPGATDAAWHAARAWVSSRLRLATSGGAVGRRHRPGRAAGRVAGSRRPPERQGGAPKPEDHSARVCGQAGAGIGSWPPARAPMRSRPGGALGLHALPSASSGRLAPLPPGMPTVLLDQRRAAQRRRSGRQARHRQLPLHASELLLHPAARKEGRGAARVRPCRLRQGWRLWPAGPAGSSAAHQEAAPQDAAASRAHTQHTHTHTHARTHARTGGL